jgi:hypothetical protein
MREREIPFPFDRSVEQPTGHIRVDGEPMAFWLPGGVTAESINLSTIEQEG